MKKAFRSVIVTAMVVSLSACSSAPDESEESAPSPSPAVEVQSGSVDPANGFDFVSTVVCPIAYPCARTVLGVVRCFPASYCR